MLKCVNAKIFKNFFAFSNSLIVSFTHSIIVSLPHCLILSPLVRDFAALNIHSLPPRWCGISLRSTFNHCLPAGAGFRCAQHSIILSLSHCLIASLPHSLIVSLSHSLPAGAGFRCAQHSLIASFTHSIIVSKQKSFHFILFRITLLMFFVSQPHKSIYPLLPKH